MLSDQMSERLFSPIQLAAIIKEAIAKEKRYLDTLVVNGKSTETSISTISAGQHLIFTEGNEYTGYRPNLALVSGQAKRGRLLVPRLLSSQPIRGGIRAQRSIRMLSSM